MKTMRKLIGLLQVMGVLAIGVAIYAWIAPARVSRWLGRDKPDRASVPAAAPTPLSPTPVLPTPAAPAAAAPPLPPLPPLPVLPGSATMLAAPNASRSQLALAHWLGNKYHTAPTILATLIVEADKLSKTYKLSPNLIIAVMAIESNFHPYIQSEAGAQGLMQVMPAIHAKRYEKFGGKSSFIDPLVSLKVGAEILRDCVKLKGSETEALRFYFGGGEASDAYIQKVRAEQQRLNLVAAGSHVPVEQN
jgi:soluble lytic murein transglycosylase-like protein